MTGAISGWLPCNRYKHLLDTRRGACRRGLGALPARRAGCWALEEGRASVAMEKTRLWEDPKLVLKLAIPIGLPLKPKGVPNPREGAERVHGG